VFENRMPRKIFGPKRDDVMGGWRNCIMRRDEVGRLFIVNGGKEGHK
jgi:hypothetical protein